MKRILPTLPLALPPLPTTSSAPPAPTLLSRAPTAPAPSAPAPTAPAPDFAAIDRALAALPQGSIAFNVPIVMMLNRSESVRLLLSPSVAVEELQKELVQRLFRGTQVQGAHVQIWVQGAEVQIPARMEARLSGANFSILALTPELQPVTSTEPTEWQWEVRPTQTGNQSLHLTLTTIWQVEEKDSTRPVRTFDRAITVQVTWPRPVSGFASEHWKWLWATFVVPIALWLWGKRRKKQRGNGF